MDVSQLGQEKGYVQLFVYRVPEKNRDALMKLLKEIVGKLKNHGTIRSEFFRLHSREAFQGFTPIADELSASAGEELWVELDYYLGREHRDKVMARLGKDASAGALFRQLRPLVSEGYSIVMGEFESMRHDL